MIESATSAFVSEAGAEAAEAVHRVRADAMVAGGSRACATTSANSAPREWICAVPTNAATSRGSDWTVTGLDPVWNTVEGGVAAEGRRGAGLMIHDRPHTLGVSLAIPAVISTDRRVRSVGKSPADGAALRRAIQEGHYGACRSAERGGQEG